MEIETIQTLISTMGFPIAISIFLLWNNRETVKHYERLLLEFRKSIDENNLKLGELITTLKRG